jgi:undecaprenyl diphosphate synthase
LGHRAGVKTVKKIVRLCGDIGIKYLTMFAFSTENWARPENEVSALMKLLVEYLRKELEELHENGVKFTFLGDRSGIPKFVLPELDRVIERTAANTGLNLQMAINYSGRQEIVYAARAIAHKVASGELDPDSIDDSVFTQNLLIPESSDLDLLIRTSGEKRISNFLLWQIAYAELVFVDKFWPDFTESDLHAAIAEYKNRERRFGRTETITAQQ